MQDIQTMLSFIGANYKDVIVQGLIMVSAIIVGIGLLKPLVFNKIKNKNLRKVALAVSNIAACFLAILITFIVQGWSFEHYLTASIALTLSCIITYWFYENTCLRNLIDTIGSTVISKVLSVSAAAIKKGDVEEVKAELKKAGDELKNLTKQEIKKTATKITEDKDLTGL